MSPAARGKASVVAIVQAAALGDLVVALPMACAIKQHDPSARVLMVAREYSRPLVEASRWLDGYLDSEAVLANPQLLREHGVTTFINPKQSMPLGVAARRAGVPMRIGKLNPRTLLWANRFVRLETRLVQRHRALLNLAFLKPMGIDIAPTVDALGGMLGLDRLQPLSAEARLLLDPDRFNLVLHPKSNGSGREWPTAHYERLLDLLPSDRLRVFVTGRANEGAVLSRESKLLERPEVVDLTGRFELGEMIAFLQAADGFIASGTGPLHIAAGVGTRALGLFPGRATITSTRWHPLGANGESLSVRSDCQPGVGTCAMNFGGGPCACLSDIRPEMVAQRVVAWLDQHRRRQAG